MADINLTAPEVAQLILSIGNAAALSTKDKTSLVAAINETLATAEAGGSPKAEKVSYSGTIGETTVANVKAALDALALGKPLDMTADYVASGATSVEQWATMAAAQTATEGAALPTPEYRVAAGRYRIVDNDNSEEHDVTIMDVPADPQRIVLISRITVDPFWYFDVCSVAEPGSNPAWLLSLSTEESVLSFTDGCVKLLPGYNKSADSDDADKILMLKRSTVGGNTSVNPQWVALTNVAEEGA